MYHQLLSANLLADQTILISRVAAAANPDAQDFKV